MDHYKEYQEEYAEAQEELENRSIVVKIIDWIRNLFTHNPFEN